MTDGLGDWSKGNKGSVYASGRHRELGVFAGSYSVCMTRAAGVFKKGERRSGGNVDFLPGREYNMEWYKVERSQQREVDEE